MPGPEPRSAPRPRRERNGVVVLGMHRSGTSALTRLISLLGAALPANILGARRGNEAGHWEPERLVALHDQMLAEAGSSWNDWRAFDPTVLGRDRLAHYKQEIRKLIADEYGSAPLLVLKEPRICRMVPLYEQIFSDLGIRPHYLHTARNPLAVIASLAARDRMTEGFAGLLWLRHELDAERATRGKPRAQVTYEGLLADWRATVDRISEALDIVWPRGVDAAAADIELHISDDLRHHAPTLADLEADVDIAGWIKRTYQALLELERGDGDEDAALAELDSVRVEFDAVAPIFGRATFPELNELRRENKQLTIEKVGLAGQVQSLTEEKEGLAGQVQSLTEEKVHLAVRVRSLAEELSAVQAQEVAANTALHTLSKEKDAIRHQLDYVTHSKSWRWTSPLRAMRRVAGAIAHALLAPSAAPRRGASGFGRWIWRHLPVAATYKQRFKGMLFSRLPSLFRWSGAYRDWSELSASPLGTWHHTTKRVTPYVPPNVPYVPRTALEPLVSRPARVICFYLPQFHTILENDAWWGEGFTEWTNVRAALPQFVGHYQPHVPGELGYYNLTDSAVQRRQIELARLYGIEGFCFYVYWFGGKRLLDTPIENYLDDERLDRPFCLCWANENWSRRWDGLDQDVLIAQDHSPADDIAFISHYARYLRDPRYIRIDGRPLLVVYRPKLLPSARRTARRWRKWCRENGVGEIYLAYTQSFDSVSPRRYGFDAAIEFPPNNADYPGPPDRLTPLRRDFASTVYDWRACVRRSDDYRDPKYRLFRAVCPGWDNTARRGNRGTIFLYNTPDLYKRWLENAVRDTMRRFDASDERLVFVNAWNEWAEGAYLEPNAQTGYAYLQATREALQAVAGPSRRRIVVVSHDAHPHGAQLIALNMAREFSREFRFDVDAIVLGEGELLERFSEVATVHEIDLEGDAEERIQWLLRSLWDKGAELAFVNSTVSGLLVPLLKSTGFQVVSLVHELRGILSSYELQEHARAIAEHSDRVVFPAEKVRNEFEEFLGSRLRQAVIRPQGLYLSSSRVDRERARERVCSALGLRADARIILSVGYADHRKGLDLFIDSCIQVLEEDPRAVAVWAGNLDARLMAAESRRIQAAGLEARFIFPGFVSEPQELYLAADVYALTSREDPFPSVVMEALEMQTPVVAFEGATGCDALLTRGCGVLVPAFDAARFAAALQELLADPASRRSLGTTGREIVRRDLNFRHFLFDLLELGGQPLPRVSVIVPNFNYATHLPERLESIARQSYPIYELIVLDDASTDDSVAVIEEILSSSALPWAIEVNKENSGSPVRQWRRGVEMARGDLVWIAEADDFADSGFLAALVPAFESPEVVLSYSQSRQVDENGRVLSEHYLDYVTDLDPERWRASYVADGRDEIASGLYVKNTIPNVSAVLFRRVTLERVLSTYDDEIFAYRNVGDWLVYLRLLEDGAISFHPSSLSSHRRHRSSITLGHFDAQHLREIVHVQRDTIERHGLDDVSRKRADAYAQSLYEQFGLESDDHSHFSEDPRIAIAK